MIVQGRGGEFQSKERLEQTGLTARGVKVVLRIRFSSGSRAIMRPSKAKSEDRMPRDFQGPMPWCVCQARRIGIGTRGVREVQQTDTIRS